MRTAILLAVMVLALSGACGRQLQTANATLADLVKTQLGAAKNATEEKAAEVVVCEGEIALKCCNLDVSTAALPKKKATSASSATGASTAATTSAPPAIVVAAPTATGTTSRPATGASSSQSASTSPGGSDDSNGGGRRLRDAAASLLSSLSGSSGASSGSSAAAGSKAASSTGSKAAVECQPGDTSDICAQAAEVLATPTCTVAAKKKPVYAHPWLGGGKAAATETILYLNNTTPLMWTDGEEFVCVCPIKPEELVVTKKLPDVKIVEAAPAKHPLLGAKSLHCPSATDCSSGGSAGASAGSYAGDSASGAAGK